MIAEQQQQQHQCNGLRSVRFFCSRKETHSTSKNKKVLVNKSSKYVRRATDGPHVEMAGVNRETFSLSLSEAKTTAVVFVLTLVTVKLVTDAIKKKRYKLPPGPRGMPLLGYLPFFGKEPPITFSNMRKQYGDVISISMGSFPAIVISGKETIKEALVTKGDDFSGRPAFTTALLLNEGRNFAFSAFGLIWKLHRKIVSNVLYSFSNARNNPIEEIICSEADIVVDEFLAESHQGFYPRKAITVAASSMVYQLCYGHHANIRDDKDFVEALTGARKFQEFTRSGSPVDVMPWLRYIMPWKVRYFQNLIKSANTRRSKKVAEHENTFNENNLRDITDGLIAAGNNLSKAEMSAGLDKRRVVESIDTILGAGGATVSATLEWSVFLMAAYPDIQEKVFQEINTVLGQERRPLLSDKSNVPYVEATLFEIMRFSSAVPFALPHCTTQDTTLNGYDIPKGTVVLVNLYSVSHDEEIWGDPQNFRPERFLDANGQLDKNTTELFIPFSLGRRRCVGEFLARMELFLFFTRMIQRCKFFKPPGIPDYTMNRVFTLSCDPEPFTVSALPR